MRPKLFFWIYPPYLITVLVSIVIFAFFTARSATDYFYDISSLQLHETARIAANLIEPLLMETDSPDSKGQKVRLQGLLEDMARGTKIRLTIIDTDGYVLADTSANPEVMDIHLYREEIQEAFSSGTGSAVRTSASTGISTSYEAYALKGPDGQVLSYIRAALPYDLIGARREELVFRVLLFGLVLAVVVSILALVVVRRLAAPILRIHRGAQAFSAGRLKERIWEEGPLEIADLAQVMNRMAVDLDERIQALGREKAQAEAILNGMSEAVVVVDGDLLVRKSNFAFRKLFSCAETGPLLGLTRSTELVDFVDAAIRAEGPLDTVLTLYGEETRRIRLGSAPLGHNSAILVFNDLTRLYRLETVRSDFTANVSHELKTPLTAIRAALETLTDLPASDSQVSSFLDIALRGVDRLEAILADLLSLARVEEEERKGLETTKVDVDTVITAVLNELSGEIEKAGFRVERNGESGFTISGHLGLVHQALFNLVENAIKYAVQGKFIGLSTELEGSFVVLSVHDRGPGIPERDRPRLFERFYRPDKARSYETGGTGLGLSIVKHIAAAHGGSVRFWCPEDGGSVFSILLPRNLL